MIQYSLLGRTAASIRLNTTNQFCLRMGTELVPETLYSNELTRLCAREDYIVLFNYPRGHMPAESRVTTKLLSEYFTFLPRFETRTFRLRIVTVMY
jgi:hypothetical protein